MTTTMLIDNTIQYLKRYASDEAITYQTKRDCIFQEIDRLEKLRKDILAMEQVKQAPKQ